MFTRGFLFTLVFSRGEVYILGEISWFLKRWLRRITYSLFNFFFLFFPENLVSDLHLNGSLGKHYISLSPKHFIKVLDPTILETVLGPLENKFMKYWYLHYKLITIFPIPHSPLTKKQNKTRKQDKRMEFKGEIETFEQLILDIM